MDFTSYSILHYYYYYIVFFRMIAHAEPIVSVLYFAHGTYRVYPEGLKFFFNFNKT